MVFLVVLAFAWLLGYGFGGGLVRLAVLWRTWLFSCLLGVLPAL